MGNPVHSEFKSFEEEAAASENATVVAPAEEVANVVTPEPEA
jgi:hypothetical protein